MHLKTAQSGVNPVWLLISKQKDPSYSILRWDYQIRNKKEEDIKTKIENSNVCVKVQDIFKHNSIKNIKVTYENQHMVSQVLTKGLVFHIFAITFNKRLFALVKPTNLNNFRIGLIMCITQWQCRYNK